MNYLRITVIFIWFIHLPLYSISLWSELADYNAPEHKKFVFITCSCNNKNWYEKNLESAFNQDYPPDKFRFIYVDESRDGTADLVAEYVTAHNEWDRFTLMRNESWQSVMHNHYKAAHMCDDDEIIVHLDGDDFAKHTQVLYLLNKAYNKWDIWLTYGQYEDWPHANLGFSIEVPEPIAQLNAFREMGFWYSHLRTCYAWLFKSIQLKDLIWQGSFIPTTPSIDYMFMFPMIEMAGQGHYLFIEDVLYLYNRSNSLSTCNMPIKLEVPPACSWKKYQPLKEKNNTITRDRSNKRSDVVIFSEDSPESLKKFLCDELPKIKDVDAVLILYKAALQCDQALYLTCLEFDSRINIVNLDKYHAPDALYTLPNDHCLIITDTYIQMNECSMSDCIYELEKTSAKAFFFGLSKESFKRCEDEINYGPFPDCKLDYRLVKLGNELLAWQFGYERYVINDPMFFSAILVRKDDVLKKLDDLDCEKWNESFHSLLNEDRDIGLFKEKSITQSDR